MNLSHRAKLLLLLYTFSGVAALAYEVLWTRMLSLQLGVSIVGVVVTVAAFMLGLGVGSGWGDRRQASVKKSLLLLGCIEMGVAIYALLLPMMMAWLQGRWLSVNDVEVWQFWQICSALLVLSLPALALGFAFPWMLRVGQSWQLSLGQLYGMNTLGGAVGALLPMFLLPWLGWQLALQCVAALGLLMGVVLLLLSVREQRREELLDVEHSMRLPPRGALFAYAGMGAAALMLEVAWTRAYGMILLRTEYVLAVILMVFLLGIGVGSVVAQRLPRDVLLRWAPMLAAAMAVMGLYAFPFVSDWGQSFTPNSLWQALLLQGSLIALCTLPVTLILGAWLPLISEKESGATLYAVNSLGAAAGALLAGFVLIPWLGTAGTWIVSALLLTLCGFYWSRQLLPNWAMALGLLVMVVGSWPVQQLPAASRLLAHEMPEAHDLYQSEDAISMTHVVERADGQRLLLADLQRMDAASDPTSVAVQRNQARLPLFLHGHPEKVLFLGLGTGITASGALAWPNVQVDAVELSQGAVYAAQHYFDQVNGGLPKRIHIIHDDARRYLMRTSNHYDVVVGDLFHPDMVGRGALLSVEQFARAKEHLNQHGLFVQWLALNQFDVASMQLVMRSFADIFPHNAMFVDGYRIALVGFESDRQDADALVAAAPNATQWGGEGGWTWLGRYWSDVDSMLHAVNGDVSRERLQSEWMPRIEYALPNMRYQSSRLPNMLHWLQQGRIKFPDAVNVLAVKPAHEKDLKRAWAATTLNVQSQWMMLQGKPDVAPLQQLAYRANPQDRWVSFALADAMFASLSHGLPQGVSERQALEKILSIRPDHEGALKAMVAWGEQHQEKLEADRYREQWNVLNPYGRLN